MLSEMLKVNQWSVQTNTSIYIYANNALLQFFYDLFKTHKPGAPIRPIVSFCGSPSPKLAQFFTKIFNPITDLSELKLKNSLQDN